MSRLARLLILAALLVAGCQPAPLAAPAPVTALTPELLLVQVTPALRPLRAAMQGCAYSLATLGLAVSELPAGEIQPGQGVILRWGAPARVDGYAVRLGSEELVIVIHPENPLPSITREQLVAVYALQTRTWDVLGAPAPQVGEEIHPWAYNPADDIQAIFEAAIAPIRADAAALAPDPDAMRQAIAADPAAIGFLPRRALDTSVKALPVTAAENLVQPILALTPAEPAALPRAWLACLQDRLAAP